MTKGIREVTPCKKFFVTRTPIKHKENPMNRKILSMKTHIHNALSNERGDFYISDGVKIIIAVVLGALLLAALTNIFNNTVIPRITTEITNLFS